MFYFNIFKGSCFSQLDTQRGLRTLDLIVLSAVLASLTDSRADAGQTWDVTAFSFMAQYVLLF